MTKQATPQARLMVVRMLRCRLKRSACAASRKTMLRRHAASTSHSAAPPPASASAARQAGHNADATAIMPSAPNASAVVRAADRQAARTSPALGSEFTSRRQAARAQPSASPLSQRQQHAFHQEIGQDRAPRGAQGFAQADLARALGHRNQHDVHHAHAAQRQRHHRDRAQKRRHRSEDVVHQFARFPRCPTCARRPCPSGSKR